MSKEELNLSLDIGSSSVHGIIAKYNKDTAKIEILSADTFFSDGIKDGAVMAIQEASNIIGKFFGKIEGEYGAKEYKTLCAIRGSLIEVSNGSAGAKVGENSSEVSEDTIMEIMGKIEDEKRIDEKHEIIQIIPREYILDEQSVQDPIGMGGKYLELNALVVVATKSNMTNIKKASNDSLELRYGYSAIGDMLVSKEDKELGCVLIDVGGMTTGIVVYLDGKIKHVFELPIGSDLVTRDIIKKLKVSQKEAKNIKEQYGAVLEDLITQDTDFEYKVSGGKQQKFTRKQLVDVIKPRIDLQIDQIYNSLKEKDIDIDLLAGGVILTGAGSMLEGMVEAFEKALNCVTKIANFGEDEVSAGADVLNSQIYTTAISILKSEYKTQIFTHQNDETKEPNFMSRIKGWFEEMS